MLLLRDIFPKYSQVCIIIGGGSLRKNGCMGDVTADGGPLGVFAHQLQTPGILKKGVPCEPSSYTRPGNVNSGVVRRRGYNVTGRQQKEDGTFKKAVKQTQVTGWAVEGTRHSQDNVVGDVLKKLTAIDIQHMHMYTSRGQR